jgi:RES domain-containing protein
MIVYRIARQDYAKDLSGSGARLLGGRWNYPGISCLYTASSRALAILEFRVHLNNLVELPSQLRLLCLEIPEISVYKLAANKLPANWRDYPAPAECMRFGTKLLQQKRHLILEIPSVIVPEEYNCIINPLHPEINQVRIIDNMPLLLDPRLFQ